MIDLIFVGCFCISMCFTKIKVLLKVNAFICTLAGMVVKVVSSLMSFLWFCFMKVKHLMCCFYGVFVVYLVGTVSTCLLHGQSFM